LQQHIIAAAKSSFYDVVEIFLPDLCDHLLTGFVQRQIDDLPDGIQVVAKQGDDRDLVRVLLCDFRYGIVEDRPVVMVEWCSGAEIREAAGAGDKTAQENGKLMHAVSFIPHERYAEVVSDFIVSFGVFLKQYQALP